MIDPKLQAELRAKYNPDGSVLRRAQIEMLDLLSFIDRICKENNLRYWLDSGTLIGAVRHGGFIPWDDDIDICMPKNDARRLKEIMGDKIWNNHIVLQTNETDPKYVNSSWMTIRDTNSEYVSDLYSHSMLKYRGLQVDVFIMEEGIPLWLLKVSSKLHSCFVFSPLNNKHGLGWLKSTVFFNYKILTKFIYPFFSVFKGRNSQISSGFGAVYMKVQNIETVYPLKKIKFENNEFLCPNKPVEYLSKLYGDWATLPKKIKTHNVSIKFYS